MRRRTALVIISHDRRFLSNLSRATVWLDRGKTRRIERGFAHFEEWRDALLAEEEREQHKLDRKIVAEEHWLRYGVTGTAQAQRAPARRLAGAARAAPHLSRRRRQRRHHRRRGGAVRQAGHRGRAHRQELRRPADRQRLLDPHPARRPHRHRRAERQRQDHADQPADRRAAPDSGTVRLGANLEHRHARPASRQPRPAGHRRRGADRRRRRHRDGQRQAQARHRLHEGLPVRAANRRARRSASSRAASAAG